MNKARRDKLLGGLLYVALIAACVAVFWFFSK